jgi:hypothetical protein
MDGSPATLRVTDLHRVIEGIRGLAGEHPATVSPEQRL